MEALGVEEIELLLILDLGTTWSEWSASRSSRALAPRKGPPLPTGQENDWVGPRAGLDIQATGKIHFHCRGSNPDCPVIQSIVRHYTD
jgi:hypothetical protein